MHTLLRVKDPARLHNAVKALDDGSIRSVATKAKMSHTFLGGLCSGSKIRLRLDAAVRLAEVLGWDVADLFELEDREALAEHDLI